MNHADNTLRSSAPETEAPGANADLDRAIRDMREALADDAPPIRQAPDGPAAARAVDKDYLLAIPVVVEAVLGSLSMPLAQLMALRPGTRIDLERRLGEPVDITANGSRIARGELTLVDSDPPAFAIVLTEVAGV